MRSSAVFLACLVAVRAAAAQPAVIVVVNPDNPIAEVSRDFVREAFLKKITQWSRGDAIRPVDLARKVPVRDRFVRDVIRKTPAQLKRYWTQQIFSGKGLPPPEVETVGAVIAFVLANKGAIAYLPPDADVRRLKVIKVR